MIDMQAHTINTNKIVMQVHTIHRNMIVMQVHSMHTIMIDMRAIQRKGENRILLDSTQSTANIYLSCSNIYHTLNDR